MRTLAGGVLLFGMLTEVLLLLLGKDLYGGPGGRKREKRSPLHSQV
jgi:hypothetical protein